jgi:hypothetical protein
MFIDKPTNPKTGAPEERNCCCDSLTHFAPPELRIWVTFCFYEHSAPPELERLARPAHPLPCPQFRLTFCSALRPLRLTLTSFAVEFFPLPEEQPQRAQS